ncbi:MAG TPA: hypothetical protein VFP05_11380 [Thermomicrobiales bacterium]|nr:hypothetical protein [Thermomicrobiales bacterium]
MRVKLFARKGLSLLVFDLTSEGVGFDIGTQRYGQVLIPKFLRAGHIQKNVGGPVESVDVDRSRGKCWGTRAGSIAESVEEVVFPQKRLEQGELP